MKRLFVVLNCILFTACQYRNLDKRNLPKEVCGDLVRVSVKKENNGRLRINEQMIKGLTVFVDDTCYIMDDIVTFHGGVYNISKDENPGVSLLLGKSFFGNIKVIDTLCVSDYKGTVDFNLPFGQRNFVIVYDTSVNENYYSAFYVP